MAQATQETINEEFDNQIGICKSFLNITEDTYDKKIVGDFINETYEIKQKHKVVSDKYVEKLKNNEIGTAESYRRAANAILAAYNDKSMSLNFVVNSRQIPEVSLHTDELYQEVNSNRPDYLTEFVYLPKQDQSSGDKFIRSLHKILIKTFKNPDVASVSMGSGRLEVRSIKTFNYKVKNPNVLTNSPPLELKEIQCKLNTEADFQVNNLSADKSSFN